MDSINSIMRHKQLEVEEKRLKAIRPVFSKTEVLRNNMIVTLGDNPLGEYNGIKENIWEVINTHAEIEEGNWIIDTPMVLECASGKGPAYEAIDNFCGETPISKVARAARIDRIIPGAGIITGYGNLIR